jgi:ribonuclease III
LLTASEWAASRLGHAFRNAALLESALTHRSAGRCNYERLEFVGDAVLNFAIAAMLYREFPDADEGDLSRYRAALVSGSSLAGVATELDLGRQLRLGSGEMKSGGDRRSSILADALEALFGAVYVDAGMATATAVIESLFADRLGALPDARDLKDSKTRLQERLQARGLPLPAYELDSVSGEPHEQWFAARCTVAALEVEARGEGPSRRRAEQEAARGVLEQMAGTVTAP